jgi:AraC-binding-like domain
MTALLAVNVLRPLDNFPLLRSAKVKEVREAFARIYAEPALVVKPRTENLNAVMNNCRLQCVELAFGTFGTEVGLDFPTSGYVAQLFPLQGTGEITCGTKSMEVAAGSACLLSSDAPHRLNFSADYAHLILRVEADVLADKLRSMIAAPLDQPLRIDTQSNPDGPAARMLQHYLPLLIETVSQNDPPFPDGWIAQTEQLLLTLLLCGYRHNYSHVLEQLASDVAPREVRLAERYIEANLQRPITLEELAEVAGTHTFGLFSAFKKYRGYSPLTFLTQARWKGGSQRK